MDRRFFRRDRLTGQLAIGAVGVLGGAAVVFGVGTASAKYHLSDIGGWLTSTKKGEVVHVNGLSGKVDGKVTLSGSTGHRMQVVQQGGVVLIVDETTGVVSRVDPAHLDVAQGATYRGAAGMQVVAARGAAYAVDQQKGSIQRLDPMTLATLGNPLGLTGPLGSAGIDADSVLWVPVPANGQAASVRAGQVSKAVGIGKAGDDIALTIAAGVPVITDLTSAQSIIVGPHGNQMRVRLPSTVARATKGTVLVPGTSDGQLVPLLAGGSLVVLNSGNGSLSSVSLKLPPHRLAAPQALGQKVYIPDQGSGNLLVYDTATDRMDRQVPVTGRPGSLDTFVKDGLLWANAPDSSEAVVIDTSGGHHPIQKYSPDVPQHANNPIPVQGVPDRGGKHDGPAPGRGRVRIPRMPHLPAPPVGAAPGAPADIRATAQPDGTIKVEFQPGGGPATGFKLLAPPGLTATPPQIQPNGPLFAFTVEGGACGPEYAFAVAALYRDGDHTSEVDSPLGEPTLSCTGPVAPGGVTGAATPRGAQISWQAPPGAAAEKVTYTVDVSGTKAFSTSNYSGTSLTIPQIWKNGPYTISVTSANAAGAMTTTVDQNLTGPSQQYPGGVPTNQAVNVHQTPSVSSGSQQITNINGAMLTVDCQKIGDPYGTAATGTGTLWDYIRYQGKAGYVPGWSVGTPQRGPNPTFDPVNEYDGLPIWECAG